MFTRKELEFIADLCKKYDAVAVADEVYENIVYPPAKHVRIGTTCTILYIQVQLIVLQQSYLSKFGRKIVLVFILIKFRCPLIKNICTFSRFQLESNNMP